MRKSSCRRATLLKTAFVVFGLGMAGCYMQSPLLSSGPTPRVEDCAMIQQATPSRYICGGKTFTAVQLSDMRNPPKTDTK